MRFEGKTGPYLQYAAVRVKSLLRKAQEEGALPGTPSLASDEERGLALQLLMFPDALAETVSRRAPNVLCDYAFGTAQAFSRFYAAHHILSEPDPVRKAALLGLAGLTLTALEVALGLLASRCPSGCDRGCGALTPSSPARASSSGQTRNWRGSFSAPRQFDRLDAR